MAGERNFLRVPPDSTGKRVRMKHTAQVIYSGKSTSDDPSYKWAVGERYNIAGLGSCHLHGYHEIDNDTGILEIHVPKVAQYTNLEPTIGGNILDTDTGNVVGVTAEYRDVYVNSYHIVGYDNPEYGADVDATGSLNVRFSEGLPQLDAFGKLRTSGATILGDYVFSDNTLPQYFTTTKWGSGVSLIHNPNLRTIEITTGTGSPTADPYTGVMDFSNAKSVTHTSNTYHHYFPGFSHLALMTVALGNSTGTEGVTQEWGYFDDDNGYFFRVRNSTAGTGVGLEFVIRSKAEGTLKEICISRDATSFYTNNVLQSTAPDGWNGDPVNGFGDSGKDLNVINDNIYWVDIQWLGAGRVRFGTYHEGQRVVIHEYYHDNNGGKPHSQTGSLPVRYQQYINANESALNSATMRVWCCSVVSEAAVDLNKQGFGQVKSFETTFSPSNINDWKGLNDTGKGDRLGVMKTGVSSSGTTVTVPNLTGIKPGHRLHIHQANGSSAELAEYTTVLEIVDSTTIKVSAAPVVDLDGSEMVRFHMNVDHEYHLVGILSPVSYIGDQTTFKNRTIYQPKSIQAWAYHANGSDAFCEVEIYTQPIVSGNGRSITIPQFDPNRVMSIVEPNNPFSGVRYYENSDGLVNYFGAGLHNSVTFVKGFSETQSIADSYGNYQSGAFKIASDYGGNNRCPIWRIYQSPSAGVATVVQINTPPTGVNFTRHRENDTALRFEGIPGAIGNALNYDSNGGVEYYVRHLDLDKLELYTDREFQNPVDTSAVVGPAVPNSDGIGGGLTWPGYLGSAGDPPPNGIGGGAWIISGYGDQLYFAIVTKPVGPSADMRAIANGDPVDGYGTIGGDITVHFKITWNEITQ